MNKPQKALREARRLSGELNNWMDVHNRLFGIGGLISELFPAVKDRTEFSRSDEYRQIMEIMDQLAGRDEEVSSDMPSGAISLRVPSSIHAALLKEARLEGISLNQLILSKIALQLKAAI